MDVYGCNGIVLLDNYWLDQLSKYNRLVIGFSGGLDSSVLLHRLAQEDKLRTKLLAVHINHGISDLACSWQDHCRDICLKLDVNYKQCTVDFDRSCNIEENARVARYTQLASFITKNDALLVAHHADDQAETMLLQLFRGAGVDGLSAMPISNSFFGGVLLRPLLNIYRATLEDYAKIHNIVWINDLSNEDTKFSRNYLRHVVMPVLRNRWPNVVGNLNVCSNNMQQAQSNLLDLANIDYDDLDKLYLCCNLISNLSESRLVNVLRNWFKNHHIKMPSTKQIQNIIKNVIFARNDSIPKFALDSFVLYRYKNKLYLEACNNQSVITETIWKYFPQDLKLTNNCILYAQKSLMGVRINSGDEVLVSVRVGGEKIRLHGQTKSLKILFQEWEVPPWLRQQIPLIYINNELAVVVGYAISDQYYAVNGVNIYTLEQKL